MSDLKIEDIKRLISEVTSASDGPEDWAEKSGLTVELLTEISRTIRGYIEWLSGNAKDDHVRVACELLLGLETAPTGETLEDDIPF